MLASNVPVKVSVPFANSGTKNTIPVASQIAITPGAASYTDGFPPLTFTPKVSGGIPPFGADFNGVLNAMSAAVRWACAGGSYSYDSAFSTAVSGYPAGAQIQRIDGTGFWLSTVDNNTTNPETGGAGWVPMENYGIATVSGISNTNVTLTALQYARPVIVLTGTLTGNVQIIFPSTLQEWLVVNNTTGFFTLTCKTLGGTGGIVGGGSQQTFWGDGTNLNILAGNTAVPLAVGPATSSSQAVNLGQFASTTQSQKLPNGTFRQWGIIIASGAANTFLTFTLPIAYPSACLFAMGVAADMGTATHRPSVSVGNYTNTTFQYTYDGTSTEIHWMTEGY
jgi:hypothetical protein